jgi:hypothetical protein
MRETKFKPEAVQLALSHESTRMISNLEREAKESLNEEIFGEKGIPFVRYRRPPGRPDLSYGEVAKIKEEQRRSWLQFWKRAKKPSSQVLLPSNAWAWDLKRLRSKTDDLARELMKTSELFLCRHVLSLVEGKGEKIKWATLNLLNDGAIVYRLWPTESYKTKSSLSANAALSVKIGLTQTLEVVELPVSGSAGIVWQGRWEWAAAIIKAWGVGDSTAGWRLERDTSAPFSGDRELYLILQLPKGQKPIYARASLKAEINPSGLESFFVYDTESTGSVEIKYHTS